MTTEFTRELAETAERVKREREAANQRARREAEKKRDKDADAAVAERVKTLKDEMKVAAAEGKRSLTLEANYYGGFGKDERLRVTGYIRWAVKNGIDTYHEETPPAGSDGDGTETFGLRW